MYCTTKNFTHPLYSLNKSECWNIFGPRVSDMGWWTWIIIIWLDKYSMCTLLRHIFKVSLHRSLTDYKEKKCNVVVGKLGSYHPHLMIEVNIIRTGANQHPVPPDIMHWGHTVPFGDSCQNEQPKFNYEETSNIRQTKMREIWGRKKTTLHY